MHTHLPEYGGYRHQLFWGTFFKGLQPPRGPVVYSNSGWPRAQTTQSICSSVLVYCTPSWWKMNASRSLNSPSHVHVPCAHAEAQEKLQHAKAGFSQPNPGWFQTSASVCNEVYAKQQESQPSEFKAFPPWN